MLEVYWGSGSPYAWRVMLALELKRIPYESKLLEFSKGHLKTPEFLALNPRGKVPVIRDGDFVLAESIAILAYLDRKHPEPPLFGRTAEETGTIWSLISAFDAYMRDPVTNLNRWLFSDKPHSPEVETWREQVAGELARIEARAKHGWFVGDAVSAADLAWFPTLRTFQRAAVRAEAKTRQVGLHPLADAYPNIAAWLKRVEQLPGYDKTFPPHWR